MDPAESRLMRKIFIKGSVAETLEKSARLPLSESPLKQGASSHTVIAHYALNGQMRSKAHTALTTPLVLHHTRIYKHTMKNHQWPFAE
jgi:hypothetical protein